MQKVPLRQSQLVFGFALGATFCLCAGVPGCEQNLLLPLIEPSLQTKLPPAQCEIPPLLPEQGVLRACAGRARSDAVSMSGSSCMFLVRFLSCKETLI
jgi:hypothetical protein